MGKGEQKKECEEFTKKQQLKEVYFLGERDDEEKARFFTTADIYCSPAPHGESFGVVLLEAMASGLPVVAFANTMGTLTGNTKSTPHAVHYSCTAGLDSFPVRFFPGLPGVRQKTGIYGQSHSQRLTADHG